MIKQCVKSVWNILDIMIQCIRRRYYRDDVLDYGFVDAHLGSFQRADVHSDPGDQHKLDAFAQLVARVDTYEAVQPLVVCTAQHTYARVVLRSHWAIGLVVENEHLEDL